MENVLINIGLYLVYALVVAVICCMLVFPFLYRTGKSMKPVLIGLGALVAVVLIAFLLGKATVDGANWIDTSLIAVYILMLGVFAALGYAWVSKLIKK